MPWLDSRFDIEVDVRDALVGFKVSGFDVRDALVGHSVAYEFDIEVDNQVLPFKLMEDVNRWEYMDLPIFRVEDQVKADEKALIESRKMDVLNPVLAPFQLAAPMELWIHDAKDMRLVLPFRVNKYIKASMDEIDIERDKMELASAAAGYYYYNSLTRLPHRVLPPGQLSYMEELLNSPEEECFKMLRMERLAMTGCYPVLMTR